MKRNKRLWFLTVLLLFAVAVLTLIMTVGQKNEKKSYTVSVIVNNSGSNRWTSLKEGVEAAAKDYHIRLKYVAAGEFWGIQNELEIISKEVESGVDGVIVQMYASDGVYEKLEPLLPKEKCVLMENDITPEEYYQTVGPDNKELGEALAERICQDFGEELKGKTVGILSGNTGQLALRQRLDGLQMKLLEAGAQIQWQLAEMGRSPDEKLFEENWSQGADIVVALENDETERAVDYMEENPEAVSGCALYGIGNSEKIVYYLDQGVIQALLVPNEFHMGYQSVEELAMKLGYHTTEKRNVTTGYLLIDKDTLYDAANQKILFPIVQ